ncbi:carbamoyl-phosphate synthase small chain [Pseudonocardia sp. N23]|nr:carbamoyl-phosphate synthase small chain [Pseudonocardia sp. N23]
MSAVGTALLVLEDGRIFRGEEFGAAGANLGEAVFTTGMTGYQETLTDPSYHRQIVVQTAPQIGNTGWNDEDDESARVQVAGYVVRDPARRPSNWRSQRALGDVLVEQGVVGVAGVDTRAVVRHLRERGAMRAGVFSGDALAPDAELVERVLASPTMEGADLYGAVSTHEPYVVPAGGTAEGGARFRVAALDVGIKANTPRMLAARGIEVHVLPAATSIEQIVDLGVDGFFLSNGPGDPATADAPVALTRAVLERGIPTFGICFGNQILARALGRGTYKMRYGHRGINVPVVEHATGRVAITSQNHGFAVEGEAGERFVTPYGPARITHTCPNDGCVEGLAGEGFPAFSVQYHPEAAAGPHDAADLFDRFVTLMADRPARGAALSPLPHRRDEEPAAVPVGDAPVDDAPVTGVAVEGVAVEDAAAELVAAELVAAEGVAVEGVAAEDAAAEDVAAEDSTRCAADDEDAVAEPAEPAAPAERVDITVHGEPTMLLPQTVVPADDPGAQQRDGQGVDETVALPRVVPGADDDPADPAPDDDLFHDSGGRHRLIERHDGEEA